MSGKIGGDLSVNLETDDLVLKKAEFDDWKAMYRNIWSRPEAANSRMLRHSCCEVCIGSAN